MFATGLIYESADTPQPTPQPHHHHEDRRPPRPQTLRPLASDLTPWFVLLGWIHYGWLDPLLLVSYRSPGVSWFCLSLRWSVLQLLVSLQHRVQLQFRRQLRSASFFKEPGEEPLVGRLVGRSVASVLIINNDNSNNRPLIG